MWRKKRHQIFTFFVLRPLFFVFFKYKYHLINLKCKLPKKPHLILFNHQTNLDPFMLGQCLNGVTYYMASEDIFNIKIWSHFIRFFVAPIPKAKSSRDLQAVKDCIKIVKEGGKIALAPEGNRTYTGKLCYIEPAIVKLIKLLKVPLCFYVIRGGFGVEPRFGNDIRKGKMFGGISKIIQPDEFLKMENEELYHVIINELNVNEFSLNGIYKSKVKAEYLERILYICPVCGAISKLYSIGNYVYCKSCNLEVEYLENLEFKSNNTNFLFKYIYEWWDYQENWIRKYIPRNDDVIFLDDHVTLRHSVRGKVKVDLVTTTLLMSRNEIIIGEYIFSLKEIDSVTVLGRNKMNIYFQNKVYQFKSDYRFNPIKYMQMYFHLKNLEKGDVENEILGI